MAKFLIESLFVNVATIANGNQIQFVLLQIELINHTIITDAYPKSVYALHPMMRKTPKIPAKFINAVLNAILNSNG